MHQWHYELEKELTQELPISQKARRTHRNHSCVMAVKQL